MKINARLNLVLPVERSDGGKLYVHSIPLPMEVFDRYFLVIAKTFAAIWDEGIGPTGGPAVAARMLKHIAQNMKVWEGPEGVEAGLMAEIRRLTSVLSPGPRGWEQVPLQDAIDRGVLDAEDQAEVENIVAFFIVASAMHKRDVAPAILALMSSLWGASTTSLSCMEYGASLTTSTQAAGSPVRTAVDLSIPS